MQRDDLADFCDVLPSDGAPVSPLVCFNEIKTSRSFDLRSMWQLLALFIFLYTQSPFPSILPLDKMTCTL